ASSLVWYGNGTNAGGSGAWNATDNRWAPTGAGVAGTWQPAKTAIFDTTGGTVTVAPAGIAANNGLKFTADGYTVGGGGISLGGSALTNAIEVSATSAEIAAAISSGAAVTKSGSGTLVLSGENTGITGGMNVAAGTLQIGKGGTAGSLAGDVTVAGGATLAFNRSDNVAIANTIGGAGALRKDVAGTLTVTGSESYSGGTVVNAGKVVVGDGTTNGSISSTGDVTVAAGTELAFNRSDAVGFAGAVNGAGTLTQRGSGLLTLSRSGTANAYGNDFTLRVENGTVDLVRSGSSLAGILGAGNTIQLAGGTLQLSANAGSSTVLTGAAIDVQSNSTIAINRLGTAANHTTTGFSTPITVRNDSTLAFDFRGLLGTGTSGTSFKGTTTYTGTVSLASNAGFAVTNSAGGNAEVIFSGPVVGGFGLTKTGDQRLTLSSSANAYTGPTNIQAGTLALGANASIASSSAISVAAGATFDVTALSGTAGTGSFQVAAAQSLGGAGTVAGNVTVGSGATVAPGTGIGTLTVT
ncbi:MAG: autotransporter-associated beta strand repeat-containing protein, partial [Planctomycetota bacterium]